MIFVLSKNHQYDIDTELLQAYESIHKVSLSNHIHSLLFVMFDKFCAKDYVHPSETEIDNLLNNYSEAEVERRVKQFLVEDIELYTELLNLTC